MGSSYIILSSLLRENLISGCASAIRSNSVMMLLSSVWLDLRNRRLAGTLKNRFFTMKFEPVLQFTGCWSVTFEPASDMLQPNSSSAVRVRSSTSATEAIEGSASPRNPMVWSANRSEASFIFDVAWRSKAMRASVSDMPQPLSTTCMLVLPASITITSICVALASSEFSTSSFITDAGRCITSPAAIWLATESGSRCIMSAMCVR